jgi:L-aminopeptidase/D-esterase-like protein
VITRVSGIRVGHWTDSVGLTGCTVVLCPPGTLGSGQVRGGAPGTRETDLLRPGTLVQEIHAVLLTGGSAFGLAAAEGVVRYLEERGIGFDTGVAKVPIVPAAVLFDLGVGDPQARPGSEEGYVACVAGGEEVLEGSVGAGTGATVAKLHGAERAVKGGLGSTALEDQGVIVGALAAVNAYGEVVADDGSVLAGARAGPASEVRTEPKEDEDQLGLPGVNTTLVVVATNATLSKERAHLLALASHEGIDAAVRPAHTMWDGDAVFTLATGEVGADQGTLESLAILAVAEAIRRAVVFTTSVSGFPTGKETAR